MSIHRRNTKTRGATYVVRWRDPRPREKTFRRKVDAERFERRILASRDAGVYRDPAHDKVTFGEWAARWWATASTGRAPKTLESYEGALRLHALPYLRDRRLVTLE